MDKNTPIVVLTPIRNEGWCLRGFLECASVWADAILISDQSDDSGVSELAREFKNVQFFRNDSHDFNERDNRSKLLAEGRKRFGRSIFISLDADERISANVMDPIVLERLRNLEPGVAVSIPFFNLKSESEGWIVPLDPICFSDDGRDPENSSPIHFPRSCFSNFKDVVDLGLVTLHLQYLDKTRYESKMRWYKSLEIVEFGHTNPIALYRRYSHLDAISAKDLVPIRPEWTRNYALRGIDPFHFVKSQTYWWEQQSLQLISRLEAKDVALFEALEPHRGLERVGLSPWQRFVFWYLTKTMRFYKGGKKSLSFLLLFALDLALSLVTKKFTPLKNSISNEKT